jgi:hypothetical protein
MSIPIQDEPESTVGRRPPPRRDPEDEAAERPRSGAGREEPEGEAGAQRRDPGTGEQGRPTPPVE